MWRARGTGARRTTVAAAQRRVQTPEPNTSVTEVRNNESRWRNHGEPSEFSDDISACTLAGHQCEHHGAIHLETSVAIWYVSACASGGVSSSFRRPSSGREGGAHPSRCRNGFLQHYDEVLAGNVSPIPMCGCSLTIVAVMWCTRGPGVRDAPLSRVRHARSKSRRKQGASSKVGDMETNGNHS